MNIKIFITAALILSCAAVSLFVPAALAAGAAPEESYWQIKKSTHFIVYYKSQDSNDYVNDVIKNAETYYEKITEDLGFRRFEFWTWDNRCKIYLYTTGKEYCEATGQPVWSGAAAYIKERTIKTFVRREEFLEIILPHEMAHLIFREFVGYHTELPLWLDEGVASLEEGAGGQQHLLIAGVLVRSNVFIPLTKLTQIRQETLAMPGIFYAEAASVIAFLLEKYGKEKFVDYCRKLRDNKNWEAALKDIYKFKDLSDMNDKWVAFLSGMGQTGTL